MLSIGQVWLSSETFNGTAVESVSDNFGNSFIITDSSMMKYSDNGAIDWILAGDVTLKAIDVSDQGEIVIAGNFSGTVDLNFSTGNDTYTAIGVKDMFFSRYSNSGQYLSSKVIVGNQDESVGDVAFGKYGEVYLSGAIISPFDSVMVSNNSSDRITNFHPGNPSSNQVGAKVVVLKYDNANQFLWSIEQAAFGVCINAYSPVLSVDMNNDLALAYYGCDQQANSTYRYKIEKYSSSGVLLWKNSLQGNYASIVGYSENQMVDVIEEVKTDDEGNVYILGALAFSLSPDPSDLTFTLDNNETGGTNQKAASFLSKYNSIGGHVWSQKIGYEGNGGGCVLNFSYGFDLEVDYKKVFVVGRFSKVIDFDPNPTNNFELTNYNHNCGNHYYDGFLSSYSEDGTFINAFQYAGPSDNVGLSVHSDKNGGLYMLGNGWDSLDVDPTSGVQLLNGAFKSHYSICTPPNTVSIAISADTICEGNSVNLSASGADSYYWNVALDSLGAYMPESSMIFQVKGVEANGCYAWEEVGVTVLQPLADTFNVTICQGAEYFFGGQNLTNSGFTTLVYTSALGCDSLSTVQLEVLPPAFSSYSIQLCQGDSTLINGNYETQTGLYYEQYQNANGCDSTVAIALQVQKPITKYFTHQICEGDSLLIGNEYQTTAGVYIDVFSGSNGCDSLIYEATLNVQSVDISLQTSGYTISANPFNDTYQWIDCSTNQPIVGETFAQFTASNSGSFALETSKNGCSDFSECVSITVVGIEELTGSKISVFPNPTRESFVLKGAMNSTLTIQTLAGETLFQSAVTEDETSISTNQFAQGTYLIYVVSEHYSKTLKLVVVK